MIYRLTNIFFIIAFTLSISCKSVDKTQDNKSRKIIETDQPDNSSIFIEANKAKILGNIEESLRLFEKCLSINPKDAASMFELAKIHINRKEYDVATHYLEQASEIEPENVYYLLLYASLLQAQEQYNPSIKVYERIIDLKPGFPEYYDKLALAYLYADKPDEALRVYSELEEKIGISEDIIMKKHSIYLQENKIDKAAAEIQKLINAFPNDSKYYAILAELYVSTGMNEKALAAYNKVKEVDPENPYIDISLADFYRKNGAYDKAFQYLKAGFLNKNLDIDSKIQVLIRYYTANEIYDSFKKEAFELSEALIATHPDDPKSYSMYGDFLYQDKQYEEARKAFKKVITLDKSKYLVWEQLLFTESELQNNDSLLAESLKAIELFPEQPLPYLFAGSVYYQQKKWEDCIVILEQGVFYVVNNNPMLEQFFAYLGDAYNQLENNDKSDECYDKVLTINPNNDYVLNNYAYYLSLRGEELQKAAQMAKKATELKPSSSNQDTYGWVLFKMEYYDESLIWIEKALSNGAQDNAVILEHLGDVLWKLDRKEEAIIKWKEAQEAGKGSDLLDKKVNEGFYFD